MVELLEILFSFGSWLESMGMAREHVLPFIVGVSILVFAPIMVIMKLKTYKRDKGLFEFITRQQSYLISLQDEETITKEQAKIIFKDRGTRIENVMFCIDDEPIGWDCGDKEIYEYDIGKPVKGLHTIKVVASDSMDGRGMDEIKILAFIT